MSRHAVHDLSHPYLIEPDLKHNFLKEGPLDTIVGLAHIELGHETLVRTVLGTLEVVNKLMGDNEITIDHALGHESTLVVADAIRKQNF